MDILAYLALGFLAALLALQAFVGWQARRMQGRAAPAEAGGGRHLYYFHSPTCAPCRSLTPVVDRLAARHANVHKVDVSRDPARAVAFGIRATPTLMLVEDGRIERVILGAVGEQALERMLAGPDGEPRR